MGPEKKGATRSGKVTVKDLLGEVKGGGGGEGRGWWGAVESTKRLTGAEGDSLPEGERKIST